MSLNRVSIQDFLSRDILILTLFPILAIFVILSIFSFIFGENILTYLYNFLLSLFGFNPNSMDEFVADSVILSTIFSSQILEWIFNILFYGLFLYIFWNISIILGLAIAELFSSTIIKKIRDRHYREIEINGYGNPLSEALFLFKITIYVILTLSIGVFIFWIPVFNFIFFYLAFYYIFHQMLIREVSSEIVSFNQFRDSKSKVSLKIHTFWLYTLSNIPILGMFMQIYSIVYISHYYFRELERVRG